MEAVNANREAHEKKPFVDEPQKKEKDNTSLKECLLFSSLLMIISCDLIYNFFLFKPKVCAVSLYIFRQRA